MRAKMKVISVNLTEHGEQLNMSVVTNGTEEDNTFAKNTPYGQLELTVNSPHLAGKFKPGQEYYLDFTESIEDEGED